MINWRKELRQSKDLKKIAITGLVLFFVLIVSLIWWNKSIAEAQNKWDENLRQQTIQIEQQKKATVNIEKDNNVWYPIRKALYLPGKMIFDDALLQRWRDVGGNTVVIDIKNSEGKVLITVRGSNEKKMPSARDVSAATNLGLIRDYKEAALSLRRLKNKYHHPFP